MKCKATLFNNFKFKNSTFSDQTITKSFGYLVEKSIKGFNGMVFRKEGRPLIGYLLKKVADVGGKVSRFRVIGICIFAFRVCQIYKHEGVKGVVMTLKTSHVLLMQSLAGYRIIDQGPLKRRVRRDRSGIPLWIPAKHRAMLRRKEIGIIRLWSSLLALYRVLDMPGSLKLNSITDDGPKLDLLKMEDKKSLNDVINNFWKRLDLPRLRNEYQETGFTLFPIGTSSPQTKNSIFGVGEESWSSRVISSTPLNIWGYSRVWTSKRQEWFLQHLNIFLSSTPKHKEWFLSTLWKVATSDFDKLVPERAKQYFSFDYKSESNFNFWLGKLGLKKEPAGKVRVFAMVDPWTQWLLYPLHKFIQGVLRRLDEDATFDQVGKLEAKLAEMQEKYSKPKAFSYDLSSATDRLPVLLQVYILAPLLGLKSAIGWANVLITRKYYISDKTAREYNIKKSERSLAYAAGQPMGALSSWVMLALTHHIIVQWSYFSAKERKVKGDWWFKDYIILGDDVVIFDPLTAARYYYIMTEKLRVEIGLAKSIVSKSSWTLEFAKKYYVGGEKANMLPLRDVIVTSIATSMLPEFIKKHSVTFNHYLKLRDLGYKARAKVTANYWNMPQRLRVYCVLQARTEKDWLDWISMKSSSANFVLNREILMAIFHLLKKDRWVIWKPLSKLADQLDSEWKFNWEHPQFETGIKSSDKGKPPTTWNFNRLGMPIRHGFLYSPLWAPLWDKTDTLDNLDLPELRDKICELHADNSHWLDKSMEFKNLTWFTYIHTPEKSFRDLQSVYKEWVKYNSIFQKSLKPITVPNFVLVDFNCNNIQFGPYASSCLSLVTLPNVKVPKSSWSFFVWNYEMGLTLERRLLQSSPTVEGEPQNEDSNFGKKLGSWKDIIFKLYFRISRIIIEIWPLMGITILLTSLSPVSVLPPRVTVEGDPQLALDNWWKFILWYALMWLLIVLLGGQPESDDPKLIPLLLSSLGNISDWEMEVLLNQDRPLSYSLTAVNEVVRSPELMHGWYEPYDPGFGIFNQ